MPLGDAQPRLPTRLRWPRASDRVGGRVYMRGSRGLSARFPYLGQPSSPTCRTRRTSFIHLVIAVLIIFGVLGTTLAKSTPANAQSILYVSGTSSSDSNACTESLPCATVSHALSVASSGDIIDVSGTIDDNIVISTSLTVTITGNSAFQPDGPAILDGTMSGTVVTVESDATVTLNDLTIENGVGVVSDSDSDGAGGGIYNDGGTVTITDSSITDNMAAAQCCGSGYGGPGGGIETDSGTLTITNTTISDNTGSGGGGVDSDSSIVTIVNSTISGNTAFPYDGGGINNADGVGDGHDSLTITSSTISGNSAYFGGGGIETDNASITSSTISGNKTLDNYGGAGIYADGPLTVTSSTISGNTGSYGGGIHFEGESDGVQLGDLEDYEQHNIGKHGKLGR